MKNISVKLYKIFRKIFIALGIIATPYVAHAGYSQRDDGPLNTSIHGTVYSLETGIPIPGIRVNVTGPELYRTGSYYDNTDENGNFNLRLPEREHYSVFFADPDGEQNGGFFLHKSRTVPLSGVNDPLIVRMGGENDVTIRGVVRSAGRSEAIAGIQLRINITETNVTLETSSDERGNFYIRVPERESYSISFADAENELFRSRTEEIGLNDTRNPLNIILTEENIITIRGFVKSAVTGKAAAGVTVRITSSNRENFLIKGYYVLTDDDGYFEIRIPERREYAFSLFANERGVFKNHWERITLSENNPVLNFSLEEF